MTTDFTFYDTSRHLPRSSPGRRRKPDWRNRHAGRADQNWKQRAVDRTRVLSAAIREIERAGQLTAEVDHLIGEREILCTWVHFVPRDRGAQRALDKLDEHLLDAIRRARRLRPGWAK
jgi:hypothetical protein